MGLINLFSDKIKEAANKQIKNKVIECFEFIECTWEIPSLENIILIFHNDILLILDNLMFVAANNKDNLMHLNCFAIKDCYHQNISVIFVCQDTMYKSEKLRQVESNSLYEAAFDNKGYRRNLYSIFFI